MSTPSLPPTDEPLPTDLQDAPGPVREAAAWLEKHTALRHRAGWAIFGSLAAGLISTSLLHDLGGWSPTLSAIPLLVSVVVVLAVAAWAARGPLQHASAHAALLARYRTLRAMGLPLESHPHAHAETTSAVALLLSRIHDLAREDEETRQAAAAAGERAMMLDRELDHLEEVLSTQPALAASLAGVRERIEGEIARIHAHLAETYAALLEVKARPGADESRPALQDALHRLRADIEIARPAHAHRATSAASRVP